MTTQTATTTCPHGHKLHKIDGGFIHEPKPGEYRNCRAAEKAATKRIPATDEALTIMAKRAIEATLEDGESREDAGERVGLTALATASFTVDADGIHITLPDGEEYTIEIVARRELIRRDGSEWCLTDQRWEKPGDMTCSHLRRAR